MHLRISQDFCWKKRRYKMCYVYIVRCADHSLYTGWTNDLAHRIQMHNAGRGAKYTRARLPVTLVYQETFSTKAEAMRREFQIKQLSRAQKLALIAASPVR